jgi:hypothetical protein
VWQRKQKQRAGSKGKAKEKKKREKREHVLTPSPLLDTMSSSCLIVVEVFESIQVLGCEPCGILSGTAFPLDEILLLTSVRSCRDDSFDLEGVVVSPVWGHSWLWWLMGRGRWGLMVELEERRMEDGVDPALLWELESVCGLVLLQDLEGAEPVGCEFWEANVFEGVRESGLVEEDLVADLEGLEAS